MSTSDDTLSRTNLNNTTAGFISESTERSNEVFSTQLLGNQLYEATIDDVKSLTIVLKALLVEDKGCVATISLTQNGFKVTTEKNHVMQANAFIGSSLFRARLQRDYEFRVDLVQFLNCLGIFTSPMADGLFFAVDGGTNVQQQGFQVPEDISLKLSMKKERYPLELTLEEAGVTTNCQLVTLDPVEPLNFELWPEDVGAKITIDTDVYRELWTELDMSSETLEIKITTDYLAFSTISDNGTITSRIDKQSDKVKKFECHELEPLCFTYDLTLMKYTLRALLPSERSNMRMGTNGVVCIHYVIKSTAESPSFVEFYCVPLVQIES